MAGACKGMEGHGRVTAGAWCFKTTNFKGRGLRPPHSSLVDCGPTAGGSGLVLDTGRWVRREACAWFAAWYPTAGAPHARIAINVSGRQLQDPKFVDEVAAVLASTGLAAERVELEITESVAMANAAATIEQLHQLAGLGVSLAVDDFGTGYSSLAYLRRFPVDVLKIDRAFVTNLEREDDDVEIVRFLISLARSLGLTTVAEGVETVAQLAALQGLGCDLVQGFLLGRPSSVEAAAVVPTRLDIIGATSASERARRVTRAAGG